MLPPLIKPVRKYETRTAEQLTRHYLVEKELANRMRHAAAPDRSHLYQEVYDELFRRVPDHPQLLRVHNEERAQAAVAEKIRYIAHLLRPDLTFLEVGAGDCRLALEAARRVKQVYAVDVSTEITRGLRTPANFQLVLSGGTDINLPTGSVDLAYSYQLMEHVHPEDARQQLSEIYRVLKPGGRYVCFTPNRLNGPHDISRYFDEVASGFHLKEYTLGELSVIFREVGFRQCRALSGLRGKAIELPLASVRIMETLLQHTPHALRSKLAELPIIRHLLDSALVGAKPKD